MYLSLTLAEDVQPTPTMETERATVNLEATDNLDASPSPTTGETHSNIPMHTVSNILATMVFVGLTMIIIACITFSVFIDIDIEYQEGDC